MRNLSPLLVGRVTEVLKDHVCQKYIFFFGRIKDKICFLRTLKDGISLKWVITLKHKQDIQFDPGK